jgi:hypothetical protein
VQLYQIICFIFCLVVIRFGTTMAPIKNCEITNAQ